MTTAAEALGEQSDLAAALASTAAQVSQQTNVEFRLYTKIALAPDSSVFWVATSQTMQVTGSLHYSTDRLQDQDQTIGSNHVLLTVNQEITQFNSVAPNTMWIGSWPTAGGEADLQVVFSQRGFYYGPSELWHYAGIAVYPAMSAQIVNSEADLPQGPIVSNSLPIWLAMNSFQDANGNPVTIPVFPSFLVPDNIVPPYIVAHIEPSATRAIQPYPIIGPWPGTTLPNTGGSPLHELPSSQLMRDEVDLTLYGFTNSMVIQYAAQLIDNSLLGMFGWANDLEIRDAKRTQVELAAIAQKKTIHVSANYYQATSDAIARRLILDAEVASIIVVLPGMVYGTGSSTLPALKTSGSGSGGFIYGPGASSLAALLTSGTGAVA